MFSPGLRGCQRSECERHVFMWFGPNGLTRSTDLPATIVNQVCGQPGDSGPPVTVNNRLVGHDPRRLHRGPAHLHRLVHSVAHPGGDDVDERGNRRRHLDDRTGRRCDLLDEPGQLRPVAAWDQRADHPHPWPQPSPPHPRRARVRDLLSQVHDRLLRPLLAADEPPAPPSIRKALHTIDIHITQRIEDARLPPTVA